MKALRIKEEKKMGKQIISSGIRIFHSSSLLTDMTDLVVYHAIFPPYCFTFDINIHKPPFEICSSRHPSYLSPGSLANVPFFLSPNFAGFPSNVFLVSAVGNKETPLSRKNINQINYKSSHRKTEGSSAFNMTYMSV